MFLIMKKNLENKTKKHTHNTKLQRTTPGAKFTAANSHAKMVKNIKRKKIFRYSPKDHI